MGQAIGSRFLLPLTNGIYERAVFFVLAGVRCEGEGLIFLSMLGAFVVVWL